MEEHQPSGMYYEDFEKGQVVVSPGRTITEYDVMAFSGLSGDYNQLHTDQVFAESSMYGKRIAHGLMGPALASGLAARLGFSDGTALALTQIKWKFTAPIYLGDTISARFTVDRKKRVSSQAGGFIRFLVDILNQEEETVQTGSWTLVMKTRETE